MEASDNTAKKKRIIIAAVAVLLIATALILFFYYRSKISATTMRILRLEGTVSLEDEGEEKPVRENLRLNSGNALSTAVKSLVSIGLDEVKIVTLDELSRALFNQNGRKLDLNLTDGSLFFEVQKPLEDDETFDISTSTMIVGIRGTSGWVTVEGDHESIIITDGHVHVIGTNPTTGEKKEIEVYAGQRIYTYLYNDRSVDSIMFYVEEITEHDLPEFILERLRENPALLEKVCKETGWDKPWILGIDVVTPTPAPVVSEDGTSDHEADESEPTPAPVEEEPVNEDSENTQKDGLTKRELDRAKSMIIAVDASTGIVALSDGTLFDPAWYAEAYPDVVEKYGSSTEALIAHYLKNGKSEGRLPLRPVTPTPTPTPTWVNNNNENNNEDNDDDDESGNNKATPPPHTVYQTVTYGTAAGADEIYSTNIPLTDQSGAVGNSLSLNAWRNTPNNYTKAIISGDAQNTQALLKLPIAVETTGGNVGNFEITRLDQVAFEPSAVDTSKFTTTSSPSSGTGAYGQGVRIEDDYGNSVVAKYDSNTSSYSYLLKDSNGNTVFEQVNGQVTTNPNNAQSIDAAVAALYP